MGRLKKVLKGQIRFSKYFLILTFILFLLGTGSTYAYYAFREENTTVITGNVIAIKAELDVELVVGTNEKMVPLKDVALANALKGTGSTNGACIDNVGNLSCQVYKITLKNLGSRLQKLQGSIELYPKEGTGNAYTNLKWRELDNPTTIKSDSVINGMSKSILVSDLTLESKQEKVWYVAVWLDEVDYDQYDIDKGHFGGTVTFELGEDNPKVVQCITNGLITQYENLSSALDEASTTSATTCTLLKNSTESITNTRALKNTTIDLNGKTLTGYIVNNNTSSNITIKNGTISSSGSYSVANFGGAVNILSGTYQNSNPGEHVYTVYSTSGTLNIKGGTFKLPNSSLGAAIMSGDVLNVQNATVTSSTYGIINAGGSDFNVIENTNITVTTNNAHGIRNDATAKLIIYGGTITGNYAIYNSNSFAVESYGNTANGRMDGPIYILWKHSSSQIGIKIMGKGNVNQCPTWTASDQSDLKWYTATTSTDAYNHSYSVCYVTKSNHTGSLFWTNFYYNNSSVGSLDHQYNWDLISNNEIAKVTSVSYSSGPSKRYYYSGDSLNTSGLKVKINYSDGTSKTIDATNYTTSTTESSNSSTTRYKLTVSYGGKTVSVDTYKLGWYGSGNAWYYYLVPYDSGNSVERITQASYNSYWSGVSKGTKLANNWAKIWDPSRGRYYWYHFNSDGSMKYGWWQIGSSWYYFKESNATITQSTWSGGVGTMLNYSPNNATSEADDVGVEQYTISGSYYSNGVYTSSNSSLNGCHKFNGSGVWLGGC